MTDKHVDQGPFSMDPTFDPDHSWGGNQQPTLDEILAQITEIQRVMSKLILSQEAQITRLQYRVERLEGRER